MSDHDLKVERTTAVAVNVPGTPTMKDILARAEQRKAAARRKAELKVAWNKVTKQYKKGPGLKPLRRKKP